MLRIKRLFVGWDATTYAVALLIALALVVFGYVVFAVAPVGAEEINEQKELAAGAREWSAETERAPHYGFTGTEYNKTEWPIVMMRMATIGQMPYSEAMRVGKYLSLLAPDPKMRTGLDWFDRNVVFKGMASVSSDLLHKPHETGMSSSQIVYARLGERWLFQAETELNVSLHPNLNADEFGFEYVHLTYFWGDRLQITAGKITNDFNFSQARLHPSWVNLSQDLSWAAGLVPESTLGGKIGWNYPISRQVILNGSFFAGTGRELSRFAADPLKGTRVGVWFPEKNLELGASYAVSRGDHIVGGYAIKKIESIQLQGEVARSSEQGTAYWMEASANLGAVMPVKNGTAQAILNRVTPVVRWQQIFVKHHNESEAEEHHDDDSVVMMPAAETEHDHESSLPEKNAQQLYVGINYQLFKIGPYAAKLQAGYAFGFGGTDNQAKAGIVFRW